MTWVIDLAVLGMEAVRSKSGTGCNMGDRLGSFWDGSYYAEIGHSVITWVIDLTVFGMAAVMPKLGTKYNIGDRLGRFWDGSRYAEIGPRM